MLTDKSSGELDRDMCELWKSALYKGRTVPNTPDPESTQEEWAAWGQFQLRRGDTELAPHEHTLSQIVRGGEEFSSVCSKVVGAVAA